MGWLDKVGDFFVDALPAVGTIVGTAIGGPAGGALGGAVGSAGSGLLGDSNAAVQGLNSAAGQGQALAQLQMEQEFNAAEAQKNRDFQLEMWNKNNEYNSPAAQLERLKQAGINPNAMFGSGGYSPVSSSAPSGATAAGSPSIANSLLLQDAQLANLMANTRNINRDADLKEQEYSYNNVTFSDRVNSLRYANDETIARLNKIGIDTQLQQQLYEFLAHKNQEELNQLRLLCDKTFAEINNLKKQGKLIDEQVKFTNKQGQLVEEQILGQQSSNSLAQIQYSFSKESGIPQGTDWSEALWKTIVNGDAGELIDTFITNVEEVAFNQVKKWAKRGYAVYDIGKKGIKAIANTFSSPPYSRSSYKGSTIYNP